MAVPADQQVESRNGRVIHMPTDMHGNGGARSSVPPSRDESPWRFVLVVGSAPDRAPTPFVLNRLSVCVLGPGALLLEEPFGPPVQIRFDWPAPTRAEAIAAAVQKVESVGLGVLRVDNDDWVTAADIAHRVGRSRETVRLWVTGQKGPGGFPPPANPRRDTTFYSWAEVLPWLRGRLEAKLPDEKPTLAAANLAVELRSLLPRLSSPDAILELLRRPHPAGAP